MNEARSKKHKKRVYLTSNQEICEKKINNNNNYTTAIVTILLSSAIIILTTLISKKINEGRDKRSPFECGFDPQTPHDYVSHHDSS
jgi:hypothetical protein